MNNLSEVRKYLIESLFYRPLDADFKNIIKVHLAMGFEDIRSKLVGIGVSRIRGEEGITLLLESEHPYIHNFLHSISRLPEVYGTPLTRIVTGKLSITPPLRIGNIRIRRVRPAPGGVSIGHYMVTAGTLGCLAEDREHNIYILSNNHILANSNNARPRDPIYQPGPYDGGTISDKIAELNRWVELRLNYVNHIDAAMASPISERDVDPEILGIGRVHGISDPRINETVYKSGRTTGVTKGYIRVIEAFVKVDYGPLGTLYFDRQILIEPGRFSSGGDSGSLILNEKRKAVGLLFAGSESHTVANPIRLVMQGLNLTGIL